MCDSKLVITIEDIDGKVQISCEGDTTIVSPPTPAQVVANHCMEFARRLLDSNAT